MGGDAVRMRMSALLDLLPQFSKKFHRLFATRFPRRRAVQSEWLAHTEHSNSASYAERLQLPGKHTGFGIVLEFDHARRLPLVALATSTECMIRYASRKSTAPAWACVVAR